MTRLVYVKTWLKTKHAILFRLSNNVVHVEFMDKSKIVISGKEDKKVIFVNKMHEMFMYPLKSV